MPEIGVFRTSIRWSFLRFELRDALVQLIEFSQASPSNQSGQQRACFARCNFTSACGFKHGPAVLSRATQLVILSRHSGDVLVTKWRFLYQKSCRHVSTAMVACKAKGSSSRPHSISCSAATSGSNVPCDRNGSESRPFEGGHPSPAIPKTY